MRLVCVWFKTECLVSRAVNPEPEIEIVIDCTSFSKVGL